MQRLTLSAKLILVLLILSAGGAVAAWRMSASFTPPAKPGNIFAVVNADRSAGARTTTIAVDWRSTRKSVIRANGYGNCSGSVSGWVVMVPNGGGDTSRFTLSTTGTIVRPPYQGMVPPEISHPCYKLERIRVR
jgi:hypothetical protein